MVLERVESTGPKLNKERCVLRQKQIHFLGYEFDASGQWPDPAKVEAIRGLATPENVQELRRELPR